MSLKDKNSNSSTRIRKINLSKVCRCCLNDKGTLKDVMNTKLPPMLQFCTSIELADNDELPKQVCITCLRLITKFYVFKKKVQRCNMLLQNLIKKRQKSNDFSDILDKAVSEADIPEKDRFLDYESEDDASVVNYKWEKVKVKAFARRNIEEIFTHISLVEPPPLVPLDISSSALVKSECTQQDVTQGDEEEEIDVITPPPLIPFKKRDIVDKPPADAFRENKDSIGIEGHIEIICLNCKETFDTTVNLSEHEKNCGKKKLQCNICQKEFSDRKKLIGHLKGHVVVKSYSCELCGKRYPNNSSLQIHTRTHTGERPFKCDKCNKGFVRFAGLKAHMKTHTQIKPYVCDICGRAFSVKSNLTRHRVLHSETLPFPCNYCDKKFGQSDNLQMHIRTNHTLERPFLCSECGSGFVSATRLRRHMWVHTGYKRYHCKQCTKSYTNAIDLRIHERLHKPGGELDKPYICYKCEKSFYQHCRLVKHMKVHEKPYSCDECGRSFFKEDTLLKHKNSEHIVLMNSIVMGCEVYVEENRSN